MDATSIQDWVTIILAVIAAASVIVKGVAMITEITPGTRDDYIVGKVDRFVHVAQKVLGAIALDSSKQKR